MAEPRARARTKNSHVFNADDLRGFLYAFGDHVAPPAQPPLDSTVQVLDEILTDFIIECCHIAATCASYSRRQKIKQDDFRWVLRHNPAMLGRVNEQLAREKLLKGQRKAFDAEAMGGGKENASDLVNVAEVGGAEDELKKKGRGRGRRKRKAEGEPDDAGTAAQGKKKAKTGSA